MKVAVLGSGMVGRAHAGRLIELGHDVTLGRRSRPPRDSEFDEWLVSAGALAVAEPAAAIHGADLVINALNGKIAVEVLSGLAGPLDGAVLVDISNPLDFSTGHLELFVCNSDSLGEQIQRALPATRVVKTLCTVTADVQVNPAVAGAATDMFLAGDDAGAKTVAGDLLQAYGWTQILDLGDITGSRALEMMLPMWLRLYQVLGTGLFNYQITVPPARN